VVKLFSKEDIELFTITIDLPTQREKGNLVEQFIAKYPLSTLKLDSISDLMIMIRKSVNELPTMVLSGIGVSLNITPENLIIDIGEETRIKKVTEKEKKIKPFVEDNLARINTDLNFIIAGILGLLNIESLKASGVFRVVRKIDFDLTFDSFLNTEFWNRFKQLEEVHFTGLKIEFDHPIANVTSHHKITLSCDERELRGIIRFRLDVKGPIDLNLMVKDKLDLINTVYEKLTEVM